MLREVCIDVVDRTGVGAFQLVCAVWLARRWTTRDVAAWNDDAYAALQLIDVITLDGASPRPPSSRADARISGPTIASESLV